MSEPAGYAPGAALFAAYPELWGRWPCLDLVNSLMSDHKGSDQVFDLLPLRGWQDAFTKLWRFELDGPDELAPVPAMLKVRRIMRATLEGWGGGRAPEAEDLRDLETILALAPLNRTLAKGASGYTIELAPSARNWTWVLSEVIVSMVRLMSEGDPARLRKCANPACSWLYYDESQAHSRLWCTSRACGNMVKVRRFRARRKRVGPRVT